MEPRLFTSITVTGILLSTQCLSNLQGHQRIVETRPAVTALALAPEGAGVLTGSQAGVMLVTPGNVPRKAFAANLDHVHHLAFSGDGTTLAVAGGSPAEFGAVEIWSWRDRTLINRFDAHDDVVYAAEWLDDTTLVTAAADRMVRVWDITTTELLATLIGHSGPVLCLAASPDGKLICTGSADQTIRVWDRATWKLLRSLTNHLGAVHSLAFSPVTSNTKDGGQSYLASAGGDSTVRIWQPAIGRMMRIVRQDSPALAVAWGSPRILYSGAKDGKLRTIDVETGDVVEQEQVTDGWIASLAVERAEERVWTGDSLGRLKLIGFPNRGQLR